MTEHGMPPHEDLLDWLQDHRESERRLRRIGYASWMVTFVAVLLYALKVAADAITLISDYGGAVFTPQGFAAFMHTVFPLIAVVGVTASLVAVLSTIGVFVRLRTASLAEIQLRLASLEQAFMDERD